MKITAYLKPGCCWSVGVRDVFAHYGLDYEEKLISDPENYAEMVTRSGQALSPCVEIDGKMLADVDAEEVEEYLLNESLVGN
jgi:monothiol glutaredoxin